MNQHNSVLVQDSLSRLESLTRNMDVPVFRRTSIKWLARNLAIRNSDHPDFQEAMDVIKILDNMGVQNS